MHLCFFSFIFFFLFSFILFFFFFFFYIFFFFFFSFIFVPFYYTSNLKMRTTKSWLYVSKHKISACTTPSTDIFLLFIVPEKTFLYIPENELEPLFFFIFRRKHFCAFQLRSTKNRTWEFGLTNSPSLLNYALTQRFQFCMLLQV